VQELSDNNITINFENFAESILKILENPTKIQQIAKELKEISDIYILGRGINYPVAREAALKLKELTYIHAEGIPGGELKHGPLASMDSNVFVIIINPNDSTYSDTLTSAREIKDRGAKIIGVSDIESDVYNYWIEIPKLDEVLYPISEIVPIQLLSYYVALEKNTDPDYPRNLAKSVTVK
jgi:glucosamine--fructose-6-phosphate aminotransferase (isomerizing)